MANNSSGVEVAQSSDAKYMLKRRSFQAWGRTFLPHQPPDIAAMDVTALDH